ncbi:hypothetical protein KP509_21G002600 [Ceratopteris richardii]|uniref:Uncharacterized protein n=1 Tax=Ceratopteris richardii TaxID=49495 RepID=A0A8T2S865_CERRI|nr:hypothetical protein KP509_21G002600 [Ceratopteris richardii]
MLVVEKAVLAMVGWNSVQTSLVTDSAFYIPRNALVEVNQSGLVGETLIDITPRDPVPKPSVGPLDPLCPSEGLIVCDKERIRGQQGVSIDDLIRLCGKMAKDTKDSDVRDLFKSAQQLENVIVGSRPLLEKVEKFTETVEPVVKDLHDGRALNDVKDLLKQTSQMVHTLKESSALKEQKKSFLKAVADLETTLNNLQDSWML